MHTLSKSFNEKALNERPFSRIKIKSRVKTGKIQKGKVKDKAS
jgi:hypothetical protein